MTFKREMPSATLRPTHNFIRSVLHVIHMKKDMITIRDVDEEVLREFRARAVKEKMKMGKAVAQAMKRWLKEKDKAKVNPKALLHAKPFDWGPGTERTSKEIDKTLYGGKK